MNELDLFAAAIALTDVQEREALLERECVGRLGLRERLSHLLEAHFRWQPDDKAQATSVKATVNLAGPEEQSEAVIAGRYTLMETIGEGGMGAVWRAKQTEPVRRQVAVKLIKAGMDSRQVLARFEAERQALAMMDHPNIAKVLDGGLHQGRPFFVMELVKGIPITEYCDQRKLTPHERLEMFISVCQAIQHAHHKGIIHRDIKPNNVLVALYDDKPVVKVIDFGVAKATGGTLTEATIDTAFNGVVGTPQYMSPEQATFNNLDIDTRSDIYALGILLYELLTGSPPFSKKELETKGLLEILRVVREEEPPRPSTRLSTADALPTLSANRGTEPRKLTGLLRNELDWIVMKALEKDRSRRYETANSFAADIEGYLAGEPVSAHPPSTLYRVKKFVRRHRGQVIAASLVLAALLAGMAGTTWGLFQAQQSADAELIARKDAQTKQIEAEEQKRRALAGEKLAGERLVQVAAEKARAEEEQRIAQAVKDFLLNKLLAQADVWVQSNSLLAQGSTSNLAKRNPTVRELLDRAAGELSEAKIERQFPRQPVVQAQILEMIGNTYFGVGEPQLALNYLTRARDLFVRQLGPDHTRTLECMNNLALVYGELDQGELALPLCKEILKQRRAKLGSDHADTLTSMNNLAMAYWISNQKELALPLFEESLKLLKAKHGMDHRNTLMSMNNLAMAYNDTGKPSRALPLFEEAYNRMKARSGEDHPDSLHCLVDLAICYQTNGMTDTAMQLLENGLRRCKAKLGPEHLISQACAESLAGLYLQTKKQDQAFLLYQEVLELRTAKWGADHSRTMHSLNHFSELCRALGKQDKVIPYYEQALKSLRVRPGVRHPNTLTMMGNLASVYQTVGRIDEAMALIREFLGHVRQSTQPDSPERGQLLSQVVLVMLLSKAYTEAEPALRECLAIRERLQPDKWNTFNMQSLLGGSLLGQKRYAEAEPLLLKGYEGMKQREKTVPQDLPRIPEALDRLIELCTAMNKPEEAKKYQALRAKYPPAKEVIQAEKK